MQWNELTALRISELVAKQILQDHRLQVLPKEEELRLQVEKTVRDNFEQETSLTEEVYQMMEDLEKQGHSFERHKMFPILKGQLAKKKGFVL